MLQLTCLGLMKSW